MKVLILGIDGYLGWPLAFHLMARGHSIQGLDNMCRRRRVTEKLGNSLTPIAASADRFTFIRDRQPNYQFANVSLGCGTVFMLSRILKQFQPDAVVHLAEQPSAPWSMQNLDQASETMADNILGTLELIWTMKEECPQAHLIKLGTMGEYGTPNCDIPEGEIPCNCLDETVDKYVSGQEYVCPMHGLQFPRRAGSWYHLTKVHDSANIEFACRNWLLRSTDIMQGPVFGVSIEAIKDNFNLLTRFDYDECFGTVINRFCVQALLGVPLTVYGKGGQTRGYLPLKDSMECITLAIENPPGAGEYRVFNQFERTYSINDLASIVKTTAAELGYNVAINHYENPRREAEQHYYNPARQKLVDLGYKPTTDITPEVLNLLKDIRPYIGRAKPELIVPCIRWDTTYRRSKIIQ